MLPTIGGIMRRSLPVIMLCAGLCVCLGGAGADDANQEKPPPPPVRRIYDVADLVYAPEVDPRTTAIVPPTEVDSGRPANSPQGSQGSRSGGGTMTTSERTDRLTKLIQECVEPAS